MYDLMSADEAHIGRWQTMDGRKEGSGNGFAMSICGFCRGIVMHKQKEEAHLNHDAKGCEWDVKVNKDGDLLAGMPLT